MPKVMTRYAVVNPDGWINCRTLSYTKKECFETFTSEVISMTRDAFNQEGYTIRRIELRIAEARP